MLQRLALLPPRPCTESFEIAAIRIVVGRGSSGEKVLFLIFFSSEKIPMVTLGEYKIYYRDNPSK